MLVSRTSRSVVEGLDRASQLAHDALEPHCDMIRLYSRGRNKHTTLNPQPQTLNPKP